MIKGKEKGILVSSGYAPFYNIVELDPNSEEWVLSCVCPVCKVYQTYLVKKEKVKLSRKEHPIMIPCITKLSNTEICNNTFKIFSF